MFSSSSRLDPSWVPMLATSWIFVYGFCSLFLDHPLNGCLPAILDILQSLYMSLYISSYISKRHLVLVPKVCLAQSWLDYSRTLRVPFLQGERMAHLYTEWYYPNCTGFSCVGRWDLWARDRTVYQAIAYKNYETYSIIFLKDGSLRVVHE